MKLSERLLRTAGARIRTMLMAAAAARLGVPDAELTAAKSTIVHAATGRKLSYAALAADAARRAPPNPATLSLKDAEDWTLIGRPVARLDLPAKTDGSAVYGIDVQVAGMKHAAIAMSPAFGGQLVSYDAEAAAILGARDDERIVAFVHIGTPTAPPSDRPRPDIDEITTFWQAP